ncbi:MAG: phage integrase N-terminal SAM-like domain-containing protein [Pseudomonadota bacterium]
MDLVHEVCRCRHLSKRTEEAYRFWIRRFIFFFSKRHPRELRESDVAQFLGEICAIFVPCTIGCVLVEVR